MPMTLIEGAYEIVGAAPDGDSVRFYPKKKEHWELVPSGRPVQSNKRGGAQLRLDAIDSLESHYTPQKSNLGITHQPRKEAREASAALLDFLGFEDVRRNEKETVTEASPQRVPGYVLTRFSDNYGRCVAFAYKGTRPEKTGDSIRLDVPLLKESLNYHMIREGFAYPTFYSKLFFDLRLELSRAAANARSEKKGVWTKDLTTIGFDVPDDVEAVQQRAFIVPKLYRRMMDYFGLNGGDTSLEGFVEYLGQRDDRIFVLAEGQVTGFDSVVEVERQQVRLTTPIDGIVFQEK